MSESPKPLKVNKRMNFVHKTLIASVVFILLLFIVPSSPVQFDVSSIFSATYVLFGILAGFFIAATLTNYFRLQSLISEETSALISLYGRAQDLTGKKATDVVEAIDQYLIRAFDYELTDYVDNTWTEFNGLFAFEKTIKKKNTNLYSSYLDFKQRFITIRQEIALTGRKIMGPVHWMLLLILAMATVFLLYCMRDDSIPSSILTVVLSSSTLLILFLLEDIDNDTFAEEKLSFKIFQRVFEELGKLPYYPQVSIINKRLKLEKGKTYRIGKYTNYPTSYDKEIITIIA